jgi:L-ascorbate metabolism protein UlaG (beta-lactamase superfamily)
MTLLIILALIVAAIVLFFQHPKFGKNATGARLLRMQASPNYSDGKFQNQSFTPDLAEGATYTKVLVKFFWGKDKRNKPLQALPSQKHDLKSLRPDENIVVWFGHSSYFMQVDGKTLLVDPVFSGSASPIPITTKAFKGADVYSVEDFPEIDFLFISHDHWDHLDYATVLKLKRKVKQVVTGLGTGAHLEHWGYKPETILEGDWYEEITLPDGFTAHPIPGRHFSGRSFIRNQNMWAGFVLKTPSFNILLGGDTGFDTHFKIIGEKYGPFDLAILECGQYNEYWKYIHMMPEEVVTAAQQLGAKKLMPVHYGKFALSVHSWDEPIVRVTTKADRQSMPVVTPMIGEIVNLNEDKVFAKWWEGVE